MTKWEPKKSAGTAKSLEIRGKKIPQPVVQILQDRGHDTPRSIENFFAPSLADLHDPLLMRGMDRAVARLVEATKKKEKVLIHGDYDADGITATALLMRNLSGLGLDAKYYIPHRLEEGYGLSMSGVQHAIDEQCTLLITVDCGSSAVAEVAYAKENHIDVIVCDHHEPGADLSEPLALLNPKIPGSGYPFTELAGVGVAFKLLCALSQETQRPREELHADLDLVCLGSVVDIVPLVDENRIIVKHGLGRMPKSRKKGIQALLKETGLAGEITSYHLGFIIGPRINACGRMHDARSALELFLTEDMSRAQEIAKSLSADNETRKEVQEETYRSARAVIEETGLAANRVIVVAGPDWHQGVLGIVASRIASEYYRPTIVLTASEDTAKGSARSIPGFDITGAIGSCASMFRKFGGHEQAAGLELDREHVARLTACVNDYAQRFDESAFEKRNLYDIELGLADISPDLVHFLKYFEPTGVSNPQPVFLARDLEVVGVPRVVGANHLMIALRQKDRVFPAIAYDRAEEILEIEIGKTRVDCLYSIAEDSFTGKKKTTLKVKDMVRIDR